MRWRELERVFEDLRDLIETVRPETRDEAIDRTYPEWFDPEVGLIVRAWLLIPYRRSNDPETVMLQLEAARSLVPELERLFERREPTLAFLECWGAFCSTASVIESIYVSEGDDAGPDRAGRAGAKAVSKDRQRRWVAHLLHRLLSQGLTRAKAEEKVAEYIRGILNDGQFPVGFDSKWFKAIMDNAEYELNTRYGEKHFYPKFIERLIRERTDDLPPIPDIDPHT